MALSSAGAGMVRRGAITYDALIWYFSLDDDALQASMAQAVIDSGVHCWPDVRWLMSVADRRDLVPRARQAGLLRYPMHIVTTPAELADACHAVGFPAVVKVGSRHGGLGKHRVRSGTDLAEATDDMAGYPFATVEPFFAGKSFRIFVAGQPDREETVCVRYDNEESWVKNAPGCEVVPDSAPSSITAEAIRAHRLFQRHGDACGTWLSGVDYLLEEETGEWHLLEWNGFPWVGNHPEVERLGTAVFDAAMTSLETVAG